MARTPNSSGRNTCSRLLRPLRELVRRRIRPVSGPAGGPRRHANQFVERGRPDIASATNPVPQNQPGLRIGIGPVDCGRLDRYRISARSSEIRVMCGCPACVKLHVVRWRLEDAGCFKRVSWNSLPFRQLHACRPCDAVASSTMFVRKARRHSADFVMFDSPILGSEEIAVQLKA